MKFFTPELYLQFNSPDEDEADRADQAWEEALLHYERRLEELRGDMPDPVKELADQRCFHDAELLSLQERNSERLLDLLSVPVVVVELKQQDQLVVLFYLLWGHVRHAPPPKTWRFSKAPRHWLYDEVDCGPLAPHAYMHRVLLSDGAELEIPFFDVFIRTLPLPSADAAGASRKGA
jgi:hypothetical protein